MLSNAYFLAKIRFDIAESEPAKNLQNFEKCISKNAFSKKGVRIRLLPGLVARDVDTPFFLFTLWKKGKTETY